MEAIQVKQLEIAMGEIYEVVVKAIRVMSRPLAFRLFECGLNCMRWRERSWFRSHVWGQNHIL